MLDFLPWSVNEPDFCPKGSGWTIRVNCLMQVIEVLHGGDLSRCVSRVYSHDL